MKLQTQCGRPRHRPDSGSVRQAQAMLLCDNVQAPNSDNAAPRILFACRRSRIGGTLGVSLLHAVLAVALAGCSLDNGPGTIFVDPGHYSVYKCNELATQLKTLGAKEKELRGLMDKASEGGGGAVIGTLAYRADYEAVLTEERLVQRQAADKKCEVAPNYQSDQTIR
jgi:hypothetical protein